MSEREGSLVPPEIVDESVRESISRLFEVESEGDVVAKVVS